MSIYFLILLFITLPIVLMVWAYSRYIRIPNDQLMVVYGRVENPNEHGVELVFGGAKFIWPIIQDYGFLDLNPMSIKVKGSFLSRDQYEIQIESTFEFRISNHPEHATNAAVRLLGLPKKNIQIIATDLSYAAIKEIVGVKDLVDLTDRRFVLSAVAKVFSAQAQEYGLELKQLYINGLATKDQLLQQLEQEIQHFEPSPETINAPLAELNEINAAIEKNARERNELIKKKIQLLSQLNRLSK